MEGDAATVLVEPRVVVRVELKLECEGRGTLSRTHAPDCEGGNSILIAEGQKVRRVGSKEDHDHVASDALLVVVRAAEY